MLSLGLKREGDGINCHAAKVFGALLQITTPHHPGNSAANYYMRGDEGSSVQAAAHTHGDR